MPCTSVEYSALVRWNTSLTRVPGWGSSLRVVVFSTFAKQIRSS